MLHNSFFRDEELYKVYKDIEHIIKKIANAYISCSLVMENETLSPHQLVVRPWQKRIFTLSLPVIILLALFGNLIVVAVFCTQNLLLKVGNTFLVSLICWLEF